MNEWLHYSANSDLARLGWALIHFLWQGIVILTVLEVALVLVGRKSAAVRYFLCGLALAAMPVCLAGTYLAMGQGSTAPITEFAAQETHAAVAAPMVAPTRMQALNVSPNARDEFPVFDLDRWMPVVSVGWIVGVLLLTGRKAGGFLVVWRLQRCGVSEPDSQLAELLRRACEKVGVDARRVVLKVSEIVSVPMAMGWLQPVILFPVALLSGLSSQEIEMLLAHELAHIRRRDYLVNLVQNVVETLFFYHPVTWWISRRMRQERENCCDDLVAAAPGEKLSYAKVLLRLESMRPAGDFQAAANGGNLRQRVERLIGRPAAKSASGWPLVLVVAGILSFVAVTVIVRGQNAPTPKTATAMSAEQAKQKGIVALVNGKPILRAQVDQQGAEMVRLLKEKFSGDDLNRRIAEKRTTILQALVDRQLIIDDFWARGKTIPPAFVDERINDIVHGEFGDDRQSFLKMLAQRGTTLEKVKSDIVDNAIVGYQRNKFVGEKINEYYNTHLELFPTDEQLHVTFTEMKGSVPVPADHIGDIASENDPRAEMARDVVRKMEAGAEGKSLPVTEGVDAKEVGLSVWITQDRFPGWWPMKWSDIERLKPGETTGVVIGDGSYSYKDGPNQNYHYYYIVRLDERRAAKASVTADTEKNKRELLDAEAKRLQDDWVSGLRAKAQIQTFDLAAETDSGASGQAPLIQAAAYQPEAGSTKTTATPMPTQPDAIPATKPTSNPEAIFAESVTMKETKGPGDQVTREYRQGGKLILQQYLGLSPGSIGQIIYCRGKALVFDKIGVAQPSGQRFAERNVAPSVLDVSVESIDADAISPARLRLLDSNSEIISEFFIDKTGLMRPITKAEHDADIAAREKAFGGHTENQSPQDAAGKPTTMVTPASQPLPVVNGRTYSITGGLLVPADNPIVQNHIASEVRWLTQKLDLNPEQQSAVHAAMDAVQRQTATKTVSQVMDTILNPVQLAAWKQIESNSEGEVTY